FGNGGPSGLAFDAQGNLYIADTTDDVIRKVDASGVITTVAGGGPTDHYGREGDDPRSIAPWGPDGVAVDARGDLFTADAGDGGPATAAGVTSPWHIALDRAGGLYITEYFTHVVRKIGPGGTISTIAGNGTEGYSGDGGPATSAQLRYPLYAAPDAAGNVYI